MRNLKVSGLIIAFSMTEIISRYRYCGKLSRSALPLMAILISVSGSADGAVVFLDTYQGNYISSGTSFGDNAPGYGLPEAQNLSVAIQFQASEDVRGLGVTLAVSDFYGASGMPKVGIYGSAEEGGPGGLMVEQVASGHSLPLTYEQPLILDIDVELSGGVSYWLALSAEDGDKYSWMGSEISGPPIWVSTNGGDWTKSAASAGQIRIEGHVTSPSVPEPSIPILAMFGFLALVRRCRDT